MAEDGNEPTSDDLWANTNPAGSQPVPPADPTLTTSHPAPTTPDPTLIQPTVGGAPPPLPPGGGPPPPTPPGGGPPDDYPNERPVWLLPVAAGLVGTLILGLVLVLLLRDNGGDDTSATTTLALTGTIVLATSIPETTIEATSSSQVEPETTLETTTTSVEGTTTTTEPATTTSTSTTTTSTNTTTSTTTTTTTEPPPPPLPDPGFATVNGITYPLQKSCFVVPLEPNSGSYQIASYMIRTGPSRLVFDRWVDEGDSQGLDGNFVDSADSLDTSDIAGETVNGPFTATMTSSSGGEPPFEVALNPPVGGPKNCLDISRTRNGDNNEISQYTRAILDVCTVKPDPALLNVAGISSEDGSFAVVDNGDGSVELTYSDPTTGGPLVDPDATVSFDEAIVFYEGRVVGEGSDSEVRNLLIEVELATPRECDASEAPG